jgi:hypothetical protein
VPSAVPSVVSTATGSAVASIALAAAVPAVTADRRIQVLENLLGGTLPTVRRIVKSS